MKTKLLILILSVMLNFNLAVVAQFSHGGMPHTITKALGVTNLKSAQIKKTVQLSGINNEHEKYRADSISKSNGSVTKKYYGKGIDVDIDIKAQANPLILDTGDKLWLYNVRSENAYAMQFYFDRFKLPKGATLYFYNEEKDMILGAFTAENNTSNLDFGTQFIKGKSIYIEYTEPEDAEFQGELHIFKTIHIFRDVFKSGPWGTSGSCNIDVSCPLGEGWKNEIASVALILSYNSKYNLAAWCSGVVLNNTRNDGRPLFLSANHCCDTTRMAEGYPRQRFDYTTWVFLFNYEDTICNGTLSLKYPTHSVYGAKYLASDGAYSPTSDFLLLELNTTKEELISYNVAFAGWEINDINSSQTPYSICIHHPSGDIKKISRDNSPPLSYDYGKAHDYFWSVVWDQGTTEFISSGSPLFNSNHRVIGQLYAGTASCENTAGSDYFGKLSYSWIKGNFAGWLDPLQTNATYVDTYNPNANGKPSAREPRYLVNPNPSNGKFYIVFSDQTVKSPVSIKIFDSKGKLINEESRKVMYNNEIDLSDQPKGLYIMIINTADAVIAEKLIRL